MHDPDLLLFLSSIFADSPGRIHALLQAVETWEDLRQKPDDWFDPLALRAETKTKFLQWRSGFNPTRYRAWVENQGIRMLGLGDPDYPSLLSEIPDPPAILYLKGNAQVLSLPGLGFVGPRKASAYGIQVAKTLVKALGSQFSTVSGLAEGVDTAAHQAALEEGFITVAVVATGLDIVYPTQNRRLAETLVQTGAMVSEFPPGTPSLAFRFPQRNRIISGLSLGVVVCEAGDKSGSLITARHALEQGREVFAVPNSIFSPHAAGVHRLIQDGAKLVQTPNDIADELGRPLEPTAKATPTQPQALPPLPNTLSADEKTILSHLDTPHSLDALAVKTGLAIGLLLPLLSGLELQGLIQDQGGSNYQRQPHL
ncbi:MAG: DNA-processing protein DprA [Candidatus Margulisiibacteriota bacterium]